MSLEYWLSAERFYEFWLIIIVTLIIIILIVLIFLHTYANMETRKRLMVGFMGFTVILSSIGLLGHFRYAPYLDQAKHINPLIRDRTPNFIDYTYFGQTELSYYTGLNDLNALREMVLYEEEQISETVIYLGEGEYTYYFKHVNGQQFRHNRYIEFIEDLDEAQLVGSRFFLKDEAFKDIGFKNPENIMFENIILPKSEEGKTFTPRDERDFLRIENTIEGWNFNR